MSDESTTNLSLNGNEDNWKRDDNKSYPSARFLVDACFQDYIHLQEKYNKLYGKISIMLAFIGIILPYMVGTFDVSSALLEVESLQVWEIVLISIHILCTVGSILLLFIGAIWMLFLLKGKNIPVFKSEDIRNKEIYREEEEHAAMWLIDKYTTCVNEIRPIISKKQIAFDKNLIMVIVSLILYAFALLLGKGGL